MGPVTETSTRSHGDPHAARPARSLAARSLWASLGVFCVVLGGIGVVVPGLPTTPFLILAASCFVRSSQRLYDWLLSNRVFGPAIKSFRDGDGVPARAKVLAISMMWLFVSFALWKGIPAHLWIARLTVLLAAVIGTLFLLRLPTKRPSR